MVIDVAPPERNSIEQISAGLIGEEANSLAQFGLLIGILLLLALLTRRRKGSSDTPWSASENDMLDDVFDTPSLVEQAQARRPSTPPNMASFASTEPLPVPQPEVAAEQPEFEIKTTSENDLEEPQQGPPLPESGLPEGWTMEQWGHYGHQYVAAQGSQTMTFSENGTELK
jgi:hypothetical protein